MRRFLLSFLFFFLLAGLFPLMAQLQPDYRRADSLALSLRGKRNITTQQLALQLTEGLPSQHEKARAIFRWITSNIAYDQKEYNQIVKSNFAPQRKKFKTDTEAKKWEGRYYMKKVNSAMRKRKAVCGGYSMLFKHLCSWANIEAEVVNGHSRALTDKIGKYKKPTHAWNAVKLDGHWYLLDATWAAGHTAEHTNRFVFDFKEHYFLTPPDQFNIDHYPEKNEWLLLPDPPSVKTFYNRPLPLSGYFTNQIIDFSPQEGIIRAEPGETIALRLQAVQEPIQEVVVYREVKGKSISKPLPSELVKTDDQEWEIQLCFPEKGRYRFTVYVNEKASLVYQAIIRPELNAKK